MIIGITNPDIGPCGSTILDGLLIWYVDKIDPLATIGGNAALLIAARLQHHLKDFLWINFYYVLY